MPSTPLTTVDNRYSSEGAKPISWLDGRALFGKAELYWVSTIRPTGPLHVTPVVGVFVDDAFYFGTGPEEQKTRNLAADPRCAVTTGCNRWNDGLDLVLEGGAVVVRDPRLLRRVADAYTTKYGSAWAAEVDGDGTFRMPDGNEPLVFEVRPARAWGFGKTDGFSHTRWTFQGSS